MNKLSGVVMSLGLMLAASPLVSGCIAAPSEIAEETSSSDDQLAQQTPQKGKVTLSCAAWNSTCRSALNKKLVAAKAKDPASVLSAMDTFTRSPQYTSVSQNEGPEPWHFCGGIGIVGICCDGENGSGTFTCDFSFYLGFDFSVSNPAGSGSNTNGTNTSGTK